MEQSNFYFVAMLIIETLEFKEMKKKTIKLNR